MNRHLHHLLPAVLSIFLVGPACNKQPTRAVDSRQNLVQQARLLVDSLSTQGQPINYRAAQPKTIRWDLSQLISIGQKQALLVPIVFNNDLLIKTNFDDNQLFHLNYLTRLLFYSDSTGKNAIAIITDFPDLNYFQDPTRSFTGIRFIEDWYGHSLEKLLFTPDGRIRRDVPTTTGTANTGMSTTGTTNPKSSKTQPDLIEVTQTCFTITGYNYSPELNETETWTENVGCEISFTYDGSNDEFGSIGSNGPGAGSGASPIAVLPGNSIIKSIKVYFQCFTNVGGSDHTYTVTLCVDQPEPGTREPWGTSTSGSSGSSSGNNPVNSGHTFLILNETYAGTTITRNVGFYPAGNVSPWSANSQGSLNDDDLHAYNISGTFTVNNAQFFNILNYVSQGNSPGYLYDLNSNNCTTFAINAVAQAGIYLPRTIGTWVDGAGNDPGDLGEDLRKNNIPGMTLNVNGSSQNSHPNVGQCN